MIHGSSRSGSMQGRAIGHMQPAANSGRPYTKAPQFLRPTEYDARWRDYAACVEIDDPELFFPVGETGPARVQIEDAKDVCYRCPVMDSCFTWALEADVEGVWGATTAKERVAFKRSAARRRAKAAVQA